MNSSLAFELDGSLRTHDPSTIVVENGKYYLFYTGRGIRVKTSSDFKTWEDIESVFTARLTWWNNVVSNFNGFIWAPDIIKVNDKWYLYYSVSSFGKNRSAIGLAINKSLNPLTSDFKWEDGGIIIESFYTNNFNAIDPAVLLDGDRLWLVFGSWWTGIKLVELDKTTGKRMSEKSPMYSLAGTQKNDIEAPYLCKRGKYYYLFVNWGLCCRGVNSTYEIRVGRSEQVTGPYRDRDGKDMREGGGTIFLNTRDNRIGPGHIAIIKVGDKEYFSYHYYDSNNMGRSALMIDELKWDEQGWPVCK
ncbi:MAG: arabinan endo-1,5-alpha-L-arabinosidase [Verrucomicrobiae bacterium]|nr:arabinan endo-1,5-alpha-L-arabinosidase [Verrucomicrobiae bacterium]